MQPFHLNTSIFVYWALSDILLLMYVYNSCIYIFQILTVFRNTAPIVMAAVATRTMYASWFRALGLEGFVGLGSGQGDGLPWNYLVRRFPSYCHY